MENQPIIRPGALVVITYLVKTKEYDPKTTESVEKEKTVTRHKWFTSMQWARKAFYNPPGALRLRYVSNQRIISRVLKDENNTVILNQNF